MSRISTSTLAAYAGRYADALSLWRRLRSLPDDIAFEQAYGVASDIGITQKPDEIGLLFELLRSERPRTVLEIGLDEGGTLFLWTRVAAADAHLISLDTRPLGPLGRCSPFALGVRRLARKGQRIDLLVPADSHSDGTLRRVETLLRGAPVDFLFVDGDHSRDGVWRDFEMYSPLVRPGGLVAFHDVSPRRAPETEGTARFWVEFSRDRETDEFVVAGEPGFGIGLYRIPA